MCNCAEDGCAYRFRTFCLFLVQRVSTRSARHWQPATLDQTSTLLGILYGYGTVCVLYCTVHTYILYVPLPSKLRSAGVSYLGTFLDRTTFACFSVYTVKSKMHRMHRRPPEQSLNRSRRYGSNRIFILFPGHSTMCDMYSTCPKDWFTLEVLLA